MDCTSARTSEMLQLIFKLIFKFQRKKGGHIKVRDMKKIKKIANEEAVIERKRVRKRYKEREKDRQKLTGEREREKINIEL